MVQSKAEIMGALNGAFDEVTALVANLSDEAFAAAPPGKWSPGMQLVHLTRSAAAVRMALRLPRGLLRLIAGTATHESRPFDALAESYRRVLAEGGKATGRYVPRPVPAARRASAEGAFRREHGRLTAGLSRWDEAALDRYLLPHPLLGKLTVREVLFFTIDHTHHHTEGIRAMTQS